MRHSATFDLRQDPDKIPVISATGEIDLTNIEQLNELIRKARTSDGSRIILNLSSVTYLDSTTFSALIKWAKHVRMIVVKPKTVNAQKLFDLVGLSRVVDVFDSIEDANADQL